MIPDCNPGICDLCNADEKVGTETSNLDLTVITEIPERAMVVCAHPDDAEIGAGGTSARWAANGCEITYVICTNGSSGSNDLDMTSDRIVQIRNEEQREAAAVIGVKNVVFLDHPDGELEADRNLLREMVEAIRTYRPDAVFTHDPFRLAGFNHRDHRNAGITVQDAVYPYARDHLHFPELAQRGITPHKVGDVYYWHADTPNCIVDVTDSIDTRIDALSRHRSQVPGLSLGQDSDRRIRDRAREAAKGAPFEYGEAFRHIAARR